jgi:hypothetical protein
MDLTRPLVVLAAAAFADFAAHASVHRSHAAVAEFKRMSPCPSTGLRRGACAGYVVDHVVPLCAGGPDAASNMQWQTVADAKVKDRAERAQCRR